MVSQYSRLDEKFDIKYSDASHTLTAQSWAFTVHKILQMFYLFFYSPNEYETKQTRTSTIALRMLSQRGDNISTELFVKTKTKIKIKKCSLMRTENVNWTLHWRQQMIVCHTRSHPNNDSRIGPTAIFGFGYTVNQPNVRSLFLFDVFVVRERWRSKLHIDSLKRRMRITRQLLRLMLTRKRFWHEN